MRLGIPWATGLEKTNVQQSVFHRQGRPSAARQGQVNRNPTRAGRLLAARHTYSKLTGPVNNQFYMNFLAKKKRIQTNIFTNHHVVMLHFTCIHRCIDIKFANDTQHVV